MERVLQSGDTTNFDDDSSKCDIIEKALDIIEKQGGKKVYDLIAAFSDTHVTRRESKNVAEKIANLYKKVSALKVTPSVQELRKATARCELLGAQEIVTANNQLIGAKKGARCELLKNKAEETEPKIKDLSAAALQDSTTETSTDQVNNLVCLSASERRESQYRNELLGLTNFRQRKRCRSVGHEFTRKIRDKLQVEQRCAEQQNDNDNEDTRYELAFKDSVLKNSQDTLELLHMKLAELFHTRTPLKNLQKQKRKGTFLKLSDLDKDQEEYDECRSECSSQDSCTTVFYDACAEPVCVLSEPTGVNSNGHRY